MLAAVEQNRQNLVDKVKSIAFSNKQIRRFNKKTETLDNPKNVLNFFHSILGSEDIMIGYFYSEDTRFNVKGSRNHFS